MKLELFLKFGDSKNIINMFANRNIGSVVDTICQDRGCQGFIAIKREIIIYPIRDSKPINKEIEFTFREY